MPTTRPLLQHLLTPCRALCAASLALAATLVPASGPQHLPPLPQQATVLAFGDSLTDGAGGSGENYPQRLAKLIGRRVLNLGENGETTAQGRVRLARVLGAQRGDLLILCLGVNDALQGVPEAQIRDNLAAMLDLAREQGLPVLLLAVPGAGDRAAAPWFAELAATHGAALDERSMVEVLRNPALKADTVHPNREGYRQLAEGVAARLLALGALPRRRAAD